jgi:hypothetical protein
MVRCENTADHILLDFDIEGQADLLGDSLTTPLRITPLHLDDGIDQFLGWALRSRPAPLRRKQQSVLSSSQNSMEIQNGRRSEHDGCTDQPRWTHQ